ncbi:hypothetical protein DAPPUDRAFT_108530 [Daphnia pulex]|uniref:Uncharacterized protein n=1 Tax=Daphnia pulex TaxID=6669 RepID=E9H0F9_DAPPU|nr:hypothetical protein DAPPUDRAFT_108530 [Daphnia pulex]|eukprot:EFX74825.1 hypothetical protein DAPPUDRAFT_108530 [Daphnia pulex]
MFVLFYFTVGEPGIGTSSVKSPILTDDEKEDVISTVQEIWVRERTKLVIRWPKDFNSAICKGVYEKNNLVDCDHRPEVAVAISSNQDNLLQLRQQLILDKSSAKKNANELRGTKQKTRRSLVYPEGDNTQEASFPVVAKKSKPNPAEKQLAKSSLLDVSKNYIYANKAKSYFAIAKLASRLKSLTLHRSKSNLTPRSLHYYGSLLSEACAKLLPSSKYRTGTARSPSRQFIS